MNILGTGFNMKSLLYCIGCGSVCINVKRDMFDGSIVLECRSCNAEEKLSVGWKSEKFEIKESKSRKKGE